jgi:hypothetical protein
MMALPLGVGLVRRAGETSRRVATPVGDALNQCDREIDTRARTWMTDVESRRGQRACDGVHVCVRPGNRSLAREAAACSY